MSVSFGYVLYSVVVHIFGVFANLAESRLIFVRFNPLTGAGTILGRLATFAVSDSCNSQATNRHKYLGINQSSF